MRCAINQTSEWCFKRFEPHTHTHTHIYIYIYIYIYKKYSLVLWYIFCITWIITVRVKITPESGLSYVQSGVNRIRMVIIYTYDWKTRLTDPRFHNFFYIKGLHNLSDKINISTIKHVIMKRTSKLIWKYSYSTDGLSTLVCRINFLNGRSKVTKWLS